MDKTPKKYLAEPYSPAWRRDATELAYSYAPDIRPCPQCNAPRAEGYCCPHCGSGD